MGRVQGIFFSRMNKVGTAGAPPGPGKQGGAWTFGGGDNDYQIYLEKPLHTFPAVPEPAHS